MLEQLASAVQVPVADFIEAGFDTLESIAGRTNEELLDIQGISEENIGTLRAALNLLISQNPQTDDEPEESGADYDDEARSWPSVNRPFTSYCTIESVVGSILTIVSFDWLQIGRAHV